MFFDQLPKEVFSLLKEWINTSRGIELKQLSMNSYPSGEEHSPQRNEISAHIAEAYVALEDLSVSLFRAGVSIEITYDSDEIESIEVYLHGEPIKYRPTPPMVHLIRAMNWPNSVSLHTNIVL